ncbi:MAG: transcriptional regulator, MarR family [Hydrocarboniphaga sp.]|uniref:MarR family winged helix-turn-helix transcriptional regulator n=1 Tax=Hydrocarboniphaga sp. TaxID=2033016 RepID=UPI002610CA52|nr:MarR family transcriptional regulator [Hydrocarboniphaga sp.]MDB5971906.1 transcriptional regulator, MarR family [Hydrocarboniphaga sp.]
MKSASRPQTTARMTKVMAEIRASHGLAEPVEFSPAQRSAHPSNSDVSESEHKESIRLCFLIYDVARMHREAYDEFMRPLGITRVQWSVLAQLSRHDGLVQTQLSELLEVKKAQAGAILTSLEAAGWVERRDDPYDKRVKRVYLVRPAHHVIRQMSILAGQYGSQILGSLSEEERAALARMLVTIKHDLKQRLLPRIEN